MKRIQLNSYFWFWTITICAFIVFVFILAVRERQYEHNDGSLKFSDTQQEYFEINNCKYYKVKVDKHDVYQYIFHTHRGRGRYRH